MVSSSPPLRFRAGYRAELHDDGDDDGAFQVPVGTLVKEGGEIVADLSHPGDEYIAALGGAGGKGNRFFLANDNRAPVTCTPGQPGQERVLYLELKTMAHAGMVGPWLHHTLRWWVPSGGVCWDGSPCCLLPRREWQLSFIPPAYAACKRVSRSLRTHLPQPSPLPVPTAGGIDSVPP